MADYVVVARIEDQTSAGANAAADALNKYADAADKVDETVKRVGPSAQTLARRFDEATRAAQDVDKAQRALASGTVTMSDAVTRGTVSQTQANAVLDALKGKLDSARIAQAALAGGSTDLAAATAIAATGHTKLAAAADVASGAHAGFYRELIVLGHEMSQGNFSRFGGSLLVLAERSGNLDGIFKGIIGTFTSLGGIVGLTSAAAAAALGVMAVNAEDANLATVRLSNQLRATRGDYESLTAAAETAAKAFAKTPGISGDESHQAAQTIAAAPTFSGSAADLDSLLHLSQNIALVWNTTLPDAAKKLADAMADPAAVAHQLATEGFPGMSAAMADTITRLQDQGHYLEAQGDVLKAYQDGVAGAAESLTPFQQALRHLDDAFTTDANAGTSWGHALGQAAMRAAATFVEQTAEIADALTKVKNLATAGARNPVDEYGRPMGDEDTPVTAPGHRSSAAGFNPLADNWQQRDAVDQRLTEAADKAAGGGSSLTGLRDQITMLHQAQDLVGANTAKWREYQDQIDKDDASIKRLTESHDHAGDALAKQLATIKDQIDANENLALAYAAGGDAVMYATAAAKAQAEAEKDYPKDAAARAAATAQLTAANIALAQSESDKKAAQDNSQSQDTLDYIHKEIDLVSATADVRSRDLAVLKETQTLEKDGVALDSVRGRSALDYATKIAEANSELAHQQQIVNDLSGYAIQAFDQVGNSIAQAFTNGSGAAVNFGNIFKAIISSTIQEVAKLAVINPILNDVLGGNNRTTAADALASLTGSGGGTGSQVFSLAKEGYSIYDNVGSGGGGLLGGVTGYINQAGAEYLPSLFGSGATNATALASESLGNVAGTSALSGASTTAGAAGGATLTGILGGAGAGFGAGTLVNNLIGGHQLGGEIGSGIGSTAGAIIGSFAGPLGTLAGGLIGGIIGGVGGGLFGPSAIQHHGWNASITETGGMLGLGSTGFDKFDGSQITSALQSQIASVNGVLQKYSELADQVSLTLGGHNSGPATPTDLSDPAAFGKLRFSSASNAALNTALAGRSFTGAGDLDQFSNLVGNTIPGLTGAAANPGALAAQVAALSASFGSAITLAQHYGLATDALTAAQTKAVQAANDNAAAVVASTSTGLLARDFTARGFSGGAALVTFDANAAQQQQQLAAQLTATFGDAYTATADYANIMGQLSGTLGDERTKLVDQIHATSTAAAEALAAQGNGYVARDMTARGDTFGASLVSFDSGAAQEQAQLMASLTAAYGDAYTSTADYAVIMGLLNKTLGDERTALVNNNPAAGTAATAISNLTTYASGLQTGADSPLSPTAQLTLARRQFNADATAAAGGDYSSVANLATYAGSFLSASRTVNGSGTGYVADYQAVLAAIQKASEVTPDTLTASVMRVTAQTQTDQLVASLADLRAEVVTLRQQLTQTTNMPARLAA